MQSIERSGRWVNKALYRSYLQFYSPYALLTLAGWPEAAQKVFNKFWAERFHIAVTADLVDAAFPFLQGLKAVISNMGKAAGPSVRSVVAALEYLAVVVIQDAIQFAADGAYCNHPVHAYLFRQEGFR